MKAFDLTLLTIVLLIAIVVLKNFIQSKDGILRKIMIAYFGCEVWINLCFIIYILFVPHSGNFEYLLPIILIPKTFVKLFLCGYLKNREKLYP